MAKKENLAGTNLKKSLLNHASVLTSFSNPSNKTKANAIYTDLSTTIGLTQNQLNTMIGDSGTIIPDHLTRPDHWEVLP